jgi:hypothetical protein
MPHLARMKRFAKPLLEIRIGLLPVGSARIDLRRASFKHSGIEARIDGVGSGSPMKIDSDSIVGHILSISD